MRNPGWVDLQVNGAIGVDFSSPELSGDDVERAVEWIFGHGTEIFLPTLVTCPEPVLLRNLDVLGETVRNRGWSSRIPGVHLEGPFLNPGAAGTHNPEWLRLPAPDEMTALARRSGIAIRLLTLAADLPGAVETIARATELGITVSTGHHLAGAEELRRAADAGARALTHLGNGLPNRIDRHRNPIWAGLAEDRLSAMVIPDGHHLPPELLKVILRAKGADRTIAVSDSSPVTGCPPGRYRIFGIEAVLEPGGRLWNPAKSCLAASSATLNDCMRYWEVHGLADAATLRKIGRDNPLTLLSAPRKSGN